MNDFILNHLYQIRIELGVSHEALAKRVGVSCQTVVSIEKGNYIPTIGLALKIAKAFEKPLEEVFEIQHDKN